MAFKHQELTSQTECIRFDPNERPRDLIHRLSAFVEDYLKNMGIAHHDETTQGDEELNKARTQCPISKEVFEYVNVQVQLTTDNFGVEV